MTGGINSQFSLGDSMRVVERWGKSWFSETKTKNPVLEALGQTSTEMTLSTIGGPKADQPIIFTLFNTARPIPKVENIDNTLLNQFDIKTFKVLSRISRLHRRTFWPLLLDRWLYHSPTFNTSLLPKMDDPFIPINLTELQIRFDACQNNTKTKLAICDALRKIKPEHMGDNAVMQSKINDTPFYLIRIVSSRPRQMPKESIIILFKVDGNVLVTDTENIAIQSNFPSSPIRLINIHPFILSLVLNGHSRGCQVSYSEEENSIYTCYTQTSVSQWRPPQKPPHWSYTNNLFSLKPAISKNPLKIQHDMIVLRTVMVAIAIFIILQILAEQSWGTTCCSVAAGGSVMYTFEKRKAKQGVINNAVSLYINEKIPSTTVVKMIASSSRAIAQLVKEKVILDKSDPGMKTPLFYATQPDIQDQLLAGGANPTYNFGDDNILVHSLKTEALDIFEKYLAWIIQNKIEVHHLLLKQMILAASVDGLRRIRTLLPKFNWDIASQPSNMNAMDHMLIELRNRPIKTEEDLKRTKETLNKIAYLIRHGARRDKVFAFVKTMHELSALPKGKKAMELAQTLGDSTNLNWITAHTLQAVWPHLLELMRPK